MRFSELVRLLEAEGFRLVKQKGSVRYYGKTGFDRLIRVDYHGAREVSDRHLPRHPEDRRYRLKTKEDAMLNLDYSLVIEATEDPNFFGFYSPDLEGFTGVGHSVEDCLYKAKWGMQEHLEVLREQGLPLPPKTEGPTVTIQDEQKAA